MIELGAVSEAAVASLGPAAGEIIASLSATFRQGHLIGANRPPSRPKAIPAYGASTAQQIDFNHSAPSWRGATAAEPQKETTMDPTDQFKTYQSDPRLQHRDGNRLILERRVAALWKRGLRPWRHRAGAESAGRCGRRRHHALRAGRNKKGELMLVRDIARRP